jgi:putative endopeptidase
MVESKYKKTRKRGKQINRPLHSMFQIHQMPPIPPVPQVQEKKRPGYDFYLHVNANWLNTVKVPSFRSSFGVSEELEEKIKNEQITILKRAMKSAEKNNTKSKAIEALGRFALSALRTSVQKHSIRLLKKMISNIFCIRDFNDIGNALGQFQKYRISTFINIYPFIASAKYKKEKISISAGELGLPDITYYLGKDPSTNRTLIAYGHFLDTIAKHLDIEPISSIVPFETDIAKAISELEKDDEKFLTGSELAHQYSKFPWEHFWMSYGIANWKSVQFRIQNYKFLPYLESITKIFTIDQWKFLLATHLILHALPLLPPPFDNYHSEFFERKLRGQKEKLPQIQLTVKLAQEWLTSTMSQVYLKECIDPGLKSSVHGIMDELTKAAIRRIQNTEWMEPRTRKIAIQKVSQMIRNIGWPSKLPPITSIELKTENLFENILLLGEERTKRDLQVLGKEINIEKTWDDPIFAVNAFYYSETNQIVIPAGSLLWPFYHPSAPIGWNYGGLGAVIAHEMTHAFDSDGKDYDDWGEKKNWWTEKDNEAYTQKTAALVELFNKAKILGKPINGALTLNENIADLGGLAIALDALNETLKGKTDTEKKEAYRNFFISYAVSWRTKDKPEKILQGLFMDRHAPAPLRVNLIVSQFDEWYFAFDIVVSDTLYIPPEERIRIF